MLLVFGAVILIRTLSIRGGWTKKSLVLQRKQQATEFKNCIYSIYPPLSSTHSWLRCSDFFNPSKKNSFGFAANRKTGQAKTYQHPYVLNYITLNGWITMNWKRFEKKRSCDNRGTILTFGWKDWRKPRYTSVVVAGVPTEIRNGHLRNTFLKCWRYTNLLVLLSSSNKA
jgi:hypothetical protein